MAGVGGGSVGARIAGSRNASNNSGGYTVDGIRLSKEDLAAAYRAFQRFDKDGSGAIDTKVQKSVLFEV